MPNVVHMVQATETDLLRLTVYPLFTIRNNEKGMFLLFRQLSVKN